MRILWQRNRRGGRRGASADSSSRSALGLRAPGFAALAIGVLALGIGAATLMFSVVDAVLLRDLPVADPDRLVWMYNLRTERDRAPLSIADFEDYRQQSSTLAGLSPFTNWTANLTGAGTPGAARRHTGGGELLSIYSAFAADRPHAAIR